MTLTGEEVLTTLPFRLLINGEWREATTGRPLLSLIRLTVRCWGMSLMPG